MKKSLILFVIIAVVILIIGIYQVNSIKSAKKEVLKFNMDYEKYTNKDIIYGTDIATIINKAIDNNEKNKLSKDEKGMYIDDGELYVGVEINITTNDTTYQMETINKVGVINFVANFNLIGFKCTNIEYHQNGRIAKIIFTQVEK